MRFLKLCSVVDLLLVGFILFLFSVCECTRCRVTEGSVKYLREKVEKLKLLKMLLFIICEAPQKISAIFKPFLAIFTLFHLTNLL